MVGMQLQQMLMAVMTFPDSLNDPSYKVSTALLPCRVRQHFQNCFPSSSSRQLCPELSKVWAPCRNTSDDNDAQHTSFSILTNPTQGIKYGKELASEMQLFVRRHSETVKSGAGQSSGLTVPQPGPDVNLVSMTLSCPTSSAMARLGQPSPRRKKKQ